MRGHFCASPVGKTAHKIISIKIFWIFLGRWKEIFLNADKLIEAANISEFFIKNITARKGHSQWHVS